MLENIDFLIADASQGDFLGDIYETAQPFAAVHGASGTYAATGVAVGPGYAVAGALAGAKGINPQATTNTITSVSDFTSYASAAANAQTRNSSSSSYSTGFGGQGATIVSNWSQNWR